MTFATLDRAKGLTEFPAEKGDEYPLPAWYREVREIPLEDLSIEDICKACRQQIHLDNVVPIAVRILQSDPLAGEMFDGELLGSLKSVPSTYWRNHEAETSTLYAIGERIVQLETVAEDVRRDVEELLAKAKPGR